MVRIIRQFLMKAFKQDKIVYQLIELIIIIIDQMIINIQDIIDY
jgi:hypothetical protein